MNFSEYLQQKKYTPATIRTYEKYLGIFIQWLATADISAATFTYNDLLDCMRYWQGKGKSKRWIHYLLCIVRHYCNYLIAENKRTDNPAAGVFIKGIIRKLPSNLLSIEELEELFKQYNIQLNVDRSKKIMLGLLIYQGITIGELMQIERSHIKLQDAKLLVKGTKRSNERLLDLKAAQMTALQDYLSTNKFKDGSLFMEKVKEPISERNINNRIKYMFDQLRKLNPKVINAKQIRSSVITEWLRNNNLRQVQYMAGHKYVSSTQRYQLSNLDDLQNELQDHHPMK